MRDDRGEREEEIKVRRENRSVERGEEREGSKEERH